MLSPLLLSVQAHSCNSVDVLIADAVMPSRNAGREV